MMRNLRKGAVEAVIAATTYGLTYLIDHVASLHLGPDETAAAVAVAVVALQIVRRIARDHVKGQPA